MDTFEVNWWQKSIFYHIYLPSFSDSDGDGIGDIRGLLNKLHTLRGDGAGALNVDGIWLSPFYPSSGHDGGYDVTDYTSIDKKFGVLKDFDDLISSCHNNGIKVIIDWIPNHTSDNHPWFLKSKSSLSNPYRDWYIWRKGKHPTAPPNNWLSFFETVGSAWSYDPETQEYYLHSFSKHQPDLNWENPSVRKVMYDQLCFWLDRGIDGIRVDSLPILGKNPSLTDNIDSKVVWGENNINWPTVHSYVREIRGICNRYSNIVVIGEVNVNSFKQLKPYLDQGELSLALNHAFVGIPWNASSYKRIIQSFQNSCGKSAWPAWYLSNHDCSRFVSRYDDNKGIGDERARAACILLLTLACTPFIYQGEELGLRDVNIPEDLRTDLIARDSCRTPYPWISPITAGEGVGFSIGKPWLPAGEEAFTKNWVDSIVNPSSLLNLYKTMISLRHEFKALTEGHIEIIPSDDDIMVYKRVSNNVCLVVLINFVSYQSTFHCPSFKIQRRLITSSLHPVWDEDNISIITLSPNEAVVLEISDSS